MPRCLPTIVRLIDLLTWMQARRVLHQALAPALPAVLALLPPTLEIAASGSSKEAAFLARALLRLEVAVIDCLGQEVSVRTTSLPSLLLVSIFLLQIPGLDCGQKVRSLLILMLTFTLLFQLPLFGFGSI